MCVGGGELTPVAQCFLASPPPKQTTELHLLQGVYVLAGEGALFCDSVIGGGLTARRGHAQSAPILSPSILTLCSTPRFRLHFAFALELNSGAFLERRNASLQLQEKNTKNKAKNEAK